MAESDDMREEMRNAITVALTLASAAQHQVVRARERARDDAQARVQASQSEAQAVAALAQARQVIDVDPQTQVPAVDQDQFAELNDPAWWDNASAEEIAAKWTDVQQASDSHDPDLAAAAQQAGTTMSEQLRERYDIDPSQVDATVDQQLDAYQQDRSRGADPAADGLLTGRSQGLGETAPVSSEDRRAQLRDQDAPEDAIDSALVVEDAFPHRTNEVHHGQQRHGAAESSESRTAQRSIARRRA